MPRRPSAARWVWLLRLARSPSETPPAGRRQRGGWLVLAWAGLVLALGAGMSGWGYTALTHDLPPVEELARFLAVPDGLFWQPTRLYAAEGGLWYPQPADTAPHPYLPLEQMPEPVVQTTLAALDPTFWEHEGIVGPWWQVDAPRTLAQRLVARFVLAARAQDPRAAWQERLLARQATARYGRGQILAWFLNSAPYGPGVYGIVDAAQHYFGKAPADLTWAEAAWLAVAARQAPRDPILAQAALADEAAALLEDLVAAGRAPAAAAQSPPPTPRAPAPTAPPAARALLDALQRGLPAWPAAERGLNVRTTLQADLMQQAACLAQAVTTLTPAAPPCPAAAGLAFYRLTQPLPGVAVHLVALDPTTGGVLAWYATPATAPRTLPVGSLVAPWVYAVAFSRGWGPATMLWDLPSQVPLGLSIANHDGRFHGPLRARRALANAYEVPLAALLAQLDPRTVWPTVRRLGLGAWPTTITWEALQGQVALSPVTVAHGLSPFATLGQQVGLPSGEGEGLQPRWWRTVQSSDGRTPAQAPVPQTQAVLDPALAYLVTHVLSDGPAHRPTLGEGDGLADLEPAALAWGQSPDGRVVWVAVWSSQRVAVVAVDGRAAADIPATALDTAARELARGWWAVVQPQPPVPWPRPAEVVEVPVCDPSGLLPTEDCPNVVLEVFLRDRVPTQADPYYRRLRVHRPSGLLATVFTPPHEVEERVFFLWPPEARPWAEEQGLPVPPHTYAPIRLPEPDPQVHLTAPEPFAYVRGQVPLQGVVQGEDVRMYRIQVGTGPAPDQWVTIAQGTAPAQGVLARWDTTGLTGLYTVQLMAIDAQDRVRTATVPVTVDAQPPRVVIQTPQDGARYCPAQPCEAGGTGSAAAAALPITIRAEDDLALAEVQAWLDGRPLARWGSPPYTLAWPPTPGTHTLRVEARDQAGNRATATVTFIVEEAP